MNTIVLQFEGRVREQPEAIAIEYNAVQLTYFELNNYANFIARDLLQKGIEPRSVIAVSGEKSPEMVAALLAILKLNCSYMPIDSSLPSPRVQSMLAHANVRYLLSMHSKSGSELENKWEGVNSIELKYTHFDNSVINENLSFEINPEDAAYIMHTSGSTGAPKAVVVPHRGVIRLLINTNYITITPEDSVLFHSNTSFDAGIFEVWSALLNGARLVISPFAIGDLPAVFKLCKENKITVLLLATGLFHIFSVMELQELLDLKYLVVGGDVMHYSAVTRALSKNQKLKIINGYGPAENTVFTTCLVIESEHDLSNPVSIGKPITGTEVYLLDNALHEVEEGEIGELYTSGLGVALGYLNNHEMTSSKFIRLSHVANNALLYRTGDMVKRLPNGNYEFVGRQDNQVKIRGFRVELTEIESVISSLNFVEDVCVCAIGYEQKKIAAFIKMSSSDQSREQVNKTSVIAYLKEKLPAYCIPSHIEINETFPLTANGKIDRAMLQKYLSVKGESTNNNGAHVYE